MKKTLSLILALVMLFSLYAVPVSAAAGDFASEATVTHGENVITASDLRRLSAGDVITITLRLTEDSGTSTMTLEGLEFDFSTYGMTYVENSAVGFEGSAISTWWSNARTTNGVLRIYQLQVRNPFTISNPVSVSARFRIDDPSVAGYDNIKPIVLNASGDVQPVTKAEYTARFNVNGGVAVSAQTVTAGTAITLPSTTREGYTFNGWTLNGQTYQAGASYTVNGDVTFTAQWTQNATPTPVPRRTR